MNTQQAYINGFVKRASEYGVDANQAAELLKSAKSKEVHDYDLLRKLEDRKMNVPLQSLFGGGVPGVAYNLYKDVTEPDDLAAYNTPSRTGHVLLGNLLGTLGGAGIGAGLGGAASALMGRDAAPMASAGAMLGGVGGSLLGGGIGAHQHNKKIEDIIKQQKLRQVLE